MGTLRLEGVGTGLRAAARPLIADFNLRLEAGEAAVLVGPAGRGKSSLLRIIAGLELAGAGRILIDGRPVQDLPPSRRGVAMVHARRVLHPHLTVHGNLSLGPLMRKAGRREADRRARRAARGLGLEELLDRLPGVLSPRERLLAGVGRAVALGPRLLLLDEPLAGFAGPARAGLLAELVALLGRLGTTLLWATREAQEAKAIGRRVPL